MELGKKPKHYLEQLKEMNTAWIIDDSLRLHVQTDAEKLLQKARKEIEFEAQAGTLWLFPAAVGTLRP